MTNGSQIVTDKKKSFFSDHRDNRFNAVFQCACEVIYHYNEIVKIDDYMDNINKKVQSVLLDLKDTRIVTFVQAYALFFINITEPYWRVL